MAKAITPPTITELAQEIVACVGKIDGQVSNLRAESVESHLRTVIRALGYRPRETKEQRAGIPDLAGQVVECLEALNGEVPESQTEWVRMHLGGILSNIKADALLKELPQELPEVPKQS